MLKQINLLRMPRAWGSFYWNLSYVASSYLLETPSGVFGIFTELIIVP